MKIRYIPGKREKELQNRKARVVAYCRVSTEMEEQESSIELQKDYYERYIKSNPDWEFAGIYYDKKSGTGISQRPGFQQMMADAMEGKIDIILCKSISRFSRNIVDGQVAARQLKSKGIEVVFEKEHLRISDPAAELMFALLSSVAQSESQSISDHMRIAYEHRFAQGRYNVASIHILGYDTVDGKLTPNKDAWMIKMAYQLFLEGKTYSEIARTLNKDGAQRLFSKSPFTADGIRVMIENETYVGDKLLQKQPHINFLTKRPDPMIPYTQYYLQNDHEAIVDRETWEAAQSRLLERKNEEKQGIHRRGKHHFLYGKVFCGSCGAPYKRRTFRAQPDDPTSWYKIWNCKERQKGKNGNHCKNRNIKEEMLLQEISRVLGWEWQGINQFDESRFVQEVKRVEVYPDHIKIDRLPLVCSSASVE